MPWARRSSASAPRKTSVFSRRARPPRAGMPPVLPSCSTTTVRMSSSTSPTTTTGSRAGSPTNRRSRLRSALWSGLPSCASTTISFSCSLRATACSMARAPLPTAKRMRSRRWMPGGRRSGASSRACGRCARVMCCCVSAGCSTTVVTVCWDVSCNGWSRARRSCWRTIAVAIRRRWMTPRESFLQCSSSSIARPRCGAPTITAATKLRRRCWSRRRCLARPPSIAM